MRKLMWCGMTGLAIVAGGYGAASFVTPNLRPTESHVSCAVEESESPSIADGCPPHAGCPHSVSVPLIVLEEETLDSSTPGRVVELPGQSTDVPATIFIPEGDEPPLALPAEDAKADDGAAVLPQPQLMPYCVDTDEIPTRMPYADGDPWPVKSSESIRPVGWFEDSTPAGPEPMPACREDENLSRQYPGCPSLDGARSGMKDGLKRGTLWQHDREPILPIAPEIQEQSVLPAFFDGETPEALEEEFFSRNDNTWLQSLSLQNLPGLHRHTVLKLLVDWGKDIPARQPVDTLEARPSDLRHDEVQADHF